MPLKVEETKQPDDGEVFYIFYEDDNKKSKYKSQPVSQVNVNLIRRERL